MNDDNEFTHDDLDALMDFLRTQARREIIEIAVNLKRRDTETVERVSKIIRDVYASRIK